MQLMTTEDVVMDSTAAAPAHIAELSHKLIHKATIGILMVDRNLVLTLWNRFMEEEYGIPADEVLGKRLDKLFPETTRDGIADYVRQVIVSGKEIHVESLRHLTQKRGWRELRSCS